jgi:hypothetical protein
MPEATAGTVPFMDERDEQLRHLREAVDRKSAEADAASRATGRRPQPDAPVSLTEEQAPRTERGRPQDVRSVRDKNSGHGKKTADKWNQ